MTTAAARKPISNFFLKKQLQLRLIYKIVAAVMISTVVCIATLQITYLVMYRNVAFYQVILDHNIDIPPRFEISSIILPGLIVSGLVNLMVGTLIGLYASRKYAVPIFKLEQWVDLLSEGRMTAKLRFREKEEFQELSGHCNQLSESLRMKFVKIKQQAESLRADKGEIAQVRAIEEVLSTLQLEAGPIEVHTQFHRISDLKDHADREAAKQSKPS